jgi:hypothetical protein
MAWAIKQIPPAAWIKVKENTRYHNYPFFQTFFKEAKASTDFLWEMSKIEPDL